MWRDFFVSMNAELLQYLRSHLTESRRALFDELIQNRTRHVVVALEDLYQPHNASAVMRSCDCFGIQDVHIIENRNPWEYRPEVERGSSKWLHLHRHNQSANNSRECLGELRKKGYKIVGTSPHTDLTIDELPLDKPFALVFGTEKKGISDIVKAESDYIVKIPMYGFTESFNISVAAAICFHSIRSRLQHSEINWRLSEADQHEIMMYWCEKSLKHYTYYLETFLQKP